MISCYLEKLGHIFKEFVTNHFSCQRNFQNNIYYEVFSDFHISDLLRYDVEILMH